MYTLTLDNDELRIVREALEAYLEEFGHEEAETLRRIKGVIGRLRSAEAG
jgi:hypothetical protein